MVGGRIDGQRGARQIAVVGAGISGLSAAHVLTRAGHDVTLFETDARLGGHAHTHEVDDGAGPMLAIDSGFIVFNSHTYPLLTRLFSELGVSTRECEMSLSVSCGGCGLEYAGSRGLRGVFPRLSYVGRGQYMRMLTEIGRFHRAARRVLVDGDDVATLGEFVRAHRYSDYFTAHFVVPLVSAVWSCPPGTSLDYPARYLFEFLHHHGMLTVWGSPQWRTVVGGSRRYVERAVKPLHAVRAGTAVRSVQRAGAGVRIRTTDADDCTFDGVVIATHANQALRMLASPSAHESRVLGAFRYSSNPTVLHTDSSLLPRAPSARASWNYRIDTCDAAPGAVRVSYDMNRLQGLAARRDYVVSLNATDTVKPDRVVASMTYEHPLYTPESVAAQHELPGLSDGVIAFAGAHHGWGFHEDGCRSGVAAAASLGSVW